ncbi:hypothetical protein D0T08_07795 [Emticicia sp. C21]|nr:hypothetical protein D0T08_07795 [Emticicia sp. C21]
MPQNQEEFIKYLIINHLIYIYSNFYNNFHTRQKVDFYPFTGNIFPKSYKLYYKMSDLHFYESINWGDVFLKNVDIKTRFF